MSVAQSQFQVMITSVKRGLILAVLLGGLLSASVLTWRLAKGSMSAAGEPVFPRSEVVIGPMMTPLGPGFLKP